MAEAVEIAFLSKRHARWGAGPTTCRWLRARLPHRTTRYGFNRCAAPRNIWSHRGVCHRFGIQAATSRMSRNSCASSTPPRRTSRRWPRPRPLPAMCGWILNCAAVRSTNTSSSRSSVPFYTGASRTPHAQRVPRMQAAGYGVRHGGARHAVFGPVTQAGCGALVGLRPWLLRLLWSPGDAEHGVAQRLVAGHLGVPPADLVRPFAVSMPTPSHFAEKARPMSTRRTIKVNYLARVEGEGRCTSGSETTVW